MGSSGYCTANLAANRSPSVAPPTIKLASGCRFCSLPHPVIITSTAKAIPAVVCLSRFICLKAVLLLLALCSKLSKPNETRISQLRYFRSYAFERKIYSARESVVGSRGKLDRIPPQAGGHGGTAPSTLLCKP